MKKFKKLVTLFMSLVCVMGTLSGCGEDSKNTLVVFNYGNYIDPAILDIFEEETGITVKYEEATTPEILYSKYHAGSIKYDVVCTSDYMLERMIKEGDLIKFDASAFEHIDNIGDSYWDFSKAFDPTNEYTIPYFYGTVGILYDTTKVTEDVDSWEILFDGSYAGDIIMMNSMRDMYMLTLKYLGYSINTTNTDEIDEAQKLIVAQKPDVQAYFVDETKDELATGNAAMGVIYSGDAFVAMEMNEDLAYAVPKEGTNLWMDSWGITKQCDNVDAAQKFLDFLCREDIAKMNFEYIYYSTPNEAVIEDMDPEVAADEMIVPPQEILDNCEVCQMTSDELLEYYNNLWKEFKAK